jgi:hypothetical protein
LGAGGEPLKKRKGQVMVNNDRIAAGSCDELQPGDAIEAFYKGTLLYRGPVTEIAPQHGLFWILDTVTGSRRLLDVAEFSIVRLPARYREVQLTAPRP